MSIPLMTAVADSGAEGELVRRIEAEATGVTVVRRCVDLADLLAAAAAGLARAAVVSADLRQLDASAVQRLAELGVGVVGLVDAGDAGATQRLHRLGVRRLLSDVAGAAEIDAVVGDAIADLDRDQALERILEWSAPAAYPEEPSPAAAATSDPLVLPADGRVVAVWGPVGSPGRTTIAVNLAAEAAALGREAICVDADTYGGTVAQFAGVLDEAAGLAAACRAANSGGLDPALLASLAVEVAPRCRVLTGIARAERWTEIRPGALASVLALCRSLADLVIVDCGFCLEQDEELAFDTAAPRRNGATLAALAAADVVVTVALADPVGLARFVRARGEALAYASGAEVQTVVNRVRRGAIGPGDPAEEIALALQRYAGVPTAAMIPDDAAATDIALAQGRLLREAAPKSAARLAIRGLATALVDEPARPRRSVLSRLRGSGSAAGATASRGAGM